jgi:hypothetical protein
MTRPPRESRIASCIERWRGALRATTPIRPHGVAAICITLAAIAAGSMTAAADEIEGDFSETATDSNVATADSIETTPAPDETEAETDQLGKWLPSLALGFDVHRQVFDVSGTSDLGFSSSDSETVITSLFSIDGALSTPPLAEGFGSPRLFGQASAQIPLSDEFTILRSVVSFPPEGRPNQPPPILEPEECPDLGGPLNKRACDQSLESILTLNWSWSAGLGAEFTLPFLDRDFKIRTSVNYFGQSLDFAGSAKRDDRAGGTQGRNGAIVETLRISGASASKTLHAIGPELGFSGEVARTGPLSLNVFAEARFYWLLNGGDIRYSTSSADGIASFVADPKSLVAQGGAGLRITWEGYDHEQRQASVGGSHAAPSATWRAAPARTTTWNIAPSQEKTAVAVAANANPRSARPGAERHLGSLGSDSPPKAASHQVAQALPSSILSADLVELDDEQPQDDTPDNPTAETDNESATEEIAEESEPEDSDEESATEEIAGRSATDSARAAYDGGALRPLNFLRLVGGCVLALPVAVLSLPGGIDNVEDMLDVFVGQPYRDTFTEPLGEF